jgi:site-specific recombinase XerD
MLKRRLKDAGLSDAFSPHSFRATGITNFLENGGTLEVAQRIAGHADSRTTQLYDRRGQKVLLEDMERIRYRAIQQFLAWSERAGYQHLEDIEPITVDGEVQKLLDAIETSTHTGLRDRALLGVLAYTFARIGAVVNLKVEDYYPSGKRFLLRFKEKGGKEKELPVHHKLEELLDQYLKLTGLGEEPGSPLFPAALGKTGKLSRRPLVRTDAADMLKRRLKQAGLPAHYSPHSFRATGITNFLVNDGTLEALSGSPATPTAGPRNSMTDAGRRCSWRTWRGFDIEPDKHKGDGDAFRRL